MADLTDADIGSALHDIDMALPLESGAALSLLLMASAGKAVAAGLSDARAVDHFITALKAARSTSNQARMN